MSTIIKIENLSKKYLIGKKNSGTLIDSISNVFKKQKGEEFWALNGVSFDVQKGDVIGVIGRNGAGKSTLLKLLSRITQPTTGQIEINGRVASLLEVGTGFHPELTGRENIYLNGTILGMKRSEINQKFDEIVEFSGVEKFLDTPVKRYSSGMYVRLAFSVAAHLDPEILIIDEVLAVGDAAFQRKCIGKMQDFSDTGRTVILVSHNINLARSICNKGVLLDKGKMLIAGNIDEVLQSYQSNLKSANKLSKENLKNRSNRTSGDCIIRSFSIKSKDGVSIDQIDENEFLNIQFEVEVQKDVPSLGVFIRIDEVFSTDPTTTIKEVITNNNLNKSTLLKVDLKIEKLLLRSGDYQFYVAIGDANCEVFYDVIDKNVDLQGLTVKPISLDSRMSLGAFSQPIDCKYSIISEDN